MSQETIQEKEYTEVSDPAVIALTPLVSVLMITYNHGPYLADAIEGVIAQQTDFPIELLIGEDCSTDNTREVALDYQRRYPQLIRVIYSEKNVGAALNFKRIVVESRGEYAALCEGDDWWCNPNKLQLQIEIFKSDPTIGAVHGDHAFARRIKNKWVITHKKGRWFSKTPSYPITGNLFPTIFSNYCLTTYTVVYKKSIVKGFISSDFFDRDAIAIDIILAAFCCAKWRVSVVNQVLSVYRLSPNSAARSGIYGLYRIVKNITHGYEKMYKYYGYRKDFDVSFSKRIYPRYIKCAFLTGNFQIISEAFDHVSKVNPETLLYPEIKFIKLITNNYLLYYLLYFIILFIYKLKEKRRSITDNINLFFEFYK